MKSIEQMGKMYFGRLWIWMDLENACDKIDRHGISQMLRMYGVGGKFLRAVWSIYIDRRACVRVGNKKKKKYLFKLKTFDITMSTYLS